ncbi:MAG TPA: hypothetical protein PLE45_10020 [Spirochaetota bacterium]|nr:hypothetical protein [Spirochaetota bacterium]HOL57520.1 hypothetical protein [Spirochaetota bacterium]HPP05003.1 hypothetical protein [Spirochaetota bacterium]
MSKKLISLFFILSLIVVLNLNGCKTTEKDKTASTTTTIESGGVDKRMTVVIDENTSKEDMKKYMKGLFDSIEEKIAKGDFEGWYKSLTTSYQSYISDPKVLKKMSDESDFLYNRNIVLKSSKDFFEYVVIQAREGRILKFVDYQYIDRQHVKVFCELEGLGKFAYNFTFENGSWKLDR